mmetsp:Transcript_9748/g.9508  ORF Transcript_9748/g.9508 Transcript_9748/m.9508 type:complete len:232 (-) Transcript_9748:590-1285(-)
MHAMVHVPELRLHPRHPRLLLLQLRSRLEPLEVDLFEASDLLLVGDVVHLAEAALVTQGRVLLPIAHHRHVPEAPRGPIDPVQILVKVLTPFLLLFLMLHLFCLLESDFLAEVVGGHVGGKVGLMGGPQLALLAQRLLPIEPRHRIRYIGELPVSVGVPLQVWVLAQVILHHRLVRRMPIILLLEAVGGGVHEVVLLDVQAHPHPRPLDLRLVFVPVPVARRHLVLGQPEL